jgi:hypothetical protein
VEQDEQASELRPGIVLELPVLNEYSFTIRTLEKF